MKKFLGTFAAIAAGFAAQASNAKVDEPAASVAVPKVDVAANGVSTPALDQKFIFDDGKGNNQAFVLRRTDSGDLLAQHYSHSSHSSHRSHSSHYSSR